jgi:hypothetical protein
MKQLDQLLFSMFTENTGRHMLDSGGAYGRNWERNQNKAVEDFIDQPSAWLDIYHREASEDRPEAFDLSPTLSLFHHLRDALDLRSDTVKSLTLDQLTTGDQTIME